MPDLTVVETIGSLSATGLLILALVALLRGWIVTGREHGRCEEQVEFWRAQALAALELAETAGR